IVTGASGGIGSCVAQKLAQRGYRIVLIARNRDRLAALARQIHPRPCLAIPLDLTKPERIAPSLRGLLAEYGPVEVLVNNAGASIYSRFLDQTPQEHERLMRVNYLAAAEMIRLVLPAMLQRQRGHIINVASVAARVGPWGHAGYAAAKAALISLTQTLAAEHADEGVHFSYVNPGIVDTPYFRLPDKAPLWRKVRRYAITPQRVSDRIVSLLDRPRLELYVPRHFRLIDWLWLIHPRLAHQVVARQSRHAEADGREAKPASPIAGLSPPAPPPAQALNQPRLGDL
ncbi:MAG TPA: SDR family NAD(P)-dependent oxidoreductase, partial [Phycisphaeraceae bacterium]